MSITPASTRLRPGWPEIARVALLVAAAAALVSPFLNGRVLGGVDAKWYGYMIGDFVQQVRDTHRFAYLGQGALAWNGGVHPFRSAPMLMLVCTAWDLVTLGRLGPFQLQHLAIVTSAVVGTLGFYLGAVGLLPGRRWWAAGFALLYASAPAWLAIVVYGDAYMSYMAFGALPLLLYGNVRAVMTGDARGYLLLGAGVALVWMCHPPIAFLSTMTTLFLQAGNLATRDRVPWRGLAAGALGFGVLGAYYFLSMSEVPPLRHSQPMVLEVARIGALAVFIVCVGRFGLGLGKWPWAVGGVAAGLLIGYRSTPWSAWAVATAVLALGTLWLARRARGGRADGAGLLALFISALAGAAVAEAVVGNLHPDRFIGGMQMLAINASHLGDMLRPLGFPLGSQQVYQPGFGLLALFLLGLVALGSRRAARQKLFWAASVGLVCCFVRIPLVSNFLVGHFPIDLTAMAGLPLPLRTMPVIASFLALGGVIWVTAVPDADRVTLRLGGGLLAAAVLWSGAQATVFIRHARMVTSTAESTAMALRSENVALARYAYDLEPIPDYFSNGVVDPMLESRLVDAAGTVVGGGPGVAGVMEAAGARHFSLICRPIAGSANWFSLEPTVTVEPGEHLLLRFAFDPKRNYTGWLEWNSEHGVREYHLPDSGLSLGFGVGEGHSAVIPLWNSGPTAEHYAISVSREPGNDLNADGGHFADLTVSRVVPGLLPVQVTSLVPYRAVVTSPGRLALETPRVFLPGYRARVDGSPVAVARSSQGLVAIPVGAGRHDVELAYVGSPRLWGGMALSAAGWLGFIVYLLAPLRVFLAHRVIRFAVVGGVVTVFFMALNAVLAKLVGFSPQVAFIAAYPCALLLHFTLNKLWTFGDKRATTRKHVGEYLVAVVITFLIQWPSFLVLQRFVGLPGWAAAGCANILQMGASYLLLRARVFGQPAEDVASLTT